MPIPRAISGPAALIAMAWFAGILTLVAEYPFGGFGKSHDKFRGMEWIVYGSVGLVIPRMYLRFSGIGLSEAGISFSFRTRPRISSFVLLTVLCISVTLALLVSRLVVFGANYHPSVVADVCTCTIVPIAEELLYRGWLQAALARTWPLAGDWTVAIANAATFSIAHLLRLVHGDPLKAMPYIIIGAFGLGITAARARQTTGTLVAPIALHAVYNVTAVLLIHALWAVSR